MTQEEEIKKCQESPAYFYNNYTEQGKIWPVNEEDWDLILKYSGRIIFHQGRQYNRMGKLIEQLKELEKHDNAKLG